MNIKKIIAKAKLFKKSWFYDPGLIYNKIGLGSYSDGSINFFKSFFLNKSWEKSGLGPLFRDIEKKDCEKYKLFISGHKKNDCLYLYKEIKKSADLFSPIMRPCNILEIGCGTSTIAMAYCFKKNKIKGKIYAVENDQKWIDITIEKLEKFGLSKYVEFFCSEPSITLINNIPVSTYQNLPSISPTIVYIDGPGRDSISGNIKGLSMKGLEFEISADILMYEYSLFLGAKIIVDGRFNNVRFLEKNLQRQYKIHKNSIDRRTVFYLIK